MESGTTKTPTKKRDHPSSSPEDNEITDNIGELRKMVDKEKVAKKLKIDNNEDQIKKKHKTKNNKINFIKP